jgi:hypothetical protein
MSSNQPSTTSMPPRSRRKLPASLRTSWHKISQIPFTRAKTPMRTLNAAAVQTVEHLCESSSGGTVILNIPAKIRAEVAKTYSDAIDRRDPAPGQRLISMVRSPIPHPTEQGN